jgi:hypothetical protein
MKANRQLYVKCEALAKEAIDEMCEELLKDGGMEAALKGLAILIQGDVLPSPIIHKLKRHAAAILSA